MLDRIRIRLIAVTFVALLALSASVVTFFETSHDDSLIDATANIAAQLEKYADRLRPGDRATVQIPKVAADELIILPAYCTKTELHRHLRNHSATFQDRLFRISGNDQ